MSLRISEKMYLILFHHSKFLKNLEAFQFNIIAKKLRNVVINRDRTTGVLASTFVSFYVLLIVIGSMNTKRVRVTFGVNQYISSHQ